MCQDRSKRCRELSLFLVKVLFKTLDNLEILLNCRSIAAQLRGMSLNQQPHHQQQQQQQAQVNIEKTFFSVKLSCSVLVSFILTIFLVLATSTTPKRKMGRMGGLPVAHEERFRFRSIRSRTPICSR